MSNFKETIIEIYKITDKYCLENKLLSDDIKYNITELNNKYSYEKFNNLPYTEIGNFVKFFDDYCFELFNILKNYTEISINDMKIVFTGRY